MDKKQFDLFQATIQWVLDEKRITEKHGKHRGIHHRQAWWAAGTITGKVLEVLTTSVPFTTSKQFRVICPSAACVAGNIVAMNGDKLVIPEAPLVNSEEQVIADYCMDDKGHLYLIGDRAAAVAGLTGDEASALFSPNNSRERVIEMATEIAAKYGYEMELV